MNTQNQAAREIAPPQPYTKPDETDVQATWRRFGWTPTQREIVVQHLPADDTEGGEA